jgi:large subunit ribosomal protein L13
MVSVCIISLLQFFNFGAFMKTYDARREDVARDWCLFDAQGVVLGRLACEVASRLRGKHKPIYTPYVDTGDFVVVVNADKVVLTGKKRTDKIYYRHSGYPGGLKETAAGKMLSEKPAQLFRQAVKGMLPKNSLGRKMIKKLKVYAGAEHKHAAQSPVLVALPE